jgi:uncharacterized membrane protein YhaH (DUF805 family)
VSFGRSVASFWRHYAVFSGRSTRSEFWWAMLFLAVVAFPVSLVDVVVFPDAVMEIGVGPISVLFFFVVLVPYAALFVRRLHDVGMAAWWVFVTLLPVAGFLFSLIIGLIDSQKGFNQFGQSVKYPEGV